MVCPLCGPRRHAIPVLPLACPLLLAIFPLRRLRLITALTPFTSAAALPALRVPARNPPTQPPTAHNIARAANARFRPGGDSLVNLLAAHGIRAYVMQSLGSQFVEVMVAHPDLAAAQAIILEHRRARLAGLEVLQRCPACAYSLSGLAAPPLCPECGRPFEPDRDALILADEFQRPESADEASAPSPHVRASRRVYQIFAGFFAILTLLPLATTLATGQPAYLILTVIPAALTLISLFFVRHAR